MHTKRERCLQRARLPFKRRPIVIRVRLFEEKQLQAWRLITAEEEEETIYFVFVARLRAWVRGKWYMAGAKGFNVFKQHAIRLQNYSRDGR